MGLRPFAVRPHTTRPASFRQQALHPQAVPTPPPRSSLSDPEEEPEEEPSLPGLPDIDEDRTDPGFPYW